MHAAPLRASAGETHRMSVDLLPPLLLLSAVVVAVLLVCGRVRWRTVGMVAAAGVVCGVLGVIVRFGPVQRAILPFRYEPAEVFMGNQVWHPHGAPAALEWVVMLGRMPAPVESDGAPPAYSVRGSGHLPAIAYHGPSSVCRVSDGLAGVAPPDPSTTPGVKVYRGVSAALFYAFGPSETNALLRASFLVFYHGAACALVFLWVRRSDRSVLTRVSVSKVDRSATLIRSAWLSVFWPGLAMLSHAFFFFFQLALFLDATRQGTYNEIPLALGHAGIAGIWFGAAAGHILTIRSVVVRMVRARAAVAGFEPVCRHCTYPVESESPRCPECGTNDPANLPAMGRAATVRRYALVGLQWCVVLVLLCAPLTLPLFGALLPARLLDIVGTVWKVIVP